MFFNPLANAQGLLILSKVYDDYVSKPIINVNILMGHLLSGNLPFAWKGGEMPNIIFWIKLQRVL